MRRRVLATVYRNGSLRRLAAGYGIFTMAEHATWIAVLVFAYERGGATEAGLVAVAMLIPAAIVAPLAATAADRLPRDRVVVAAYGIQAGAFGLAGLALHFGAPIPVAYGAAMLASTSVVLIRPAQGALVPHLATTPDELTAIYALSGAIESAAILFGPAAAAAILALSDPGAVFLVFAVLLAISALVMRGLDLRAGVTSTTSAAPIDEGADDPDWSGSALEGFRTLAEQPGARLVISVVASAWVLWGAIDVFSVMLAIDVLRLGQAGAGFLISAIGAGGIIGAVLGLSLVGRRRLTVPLLAGLLAWGVPLAVIGVLPDLGVAVLVAVLAGGGRSVLDLAGRTLLQRVTTDDVLARILGILEGLQMAALAVGSIGAPVLVAAFGPRGALVAAGLTLPVVGIVGWRGLRAIDTGVAAPLERIAALREVPMFRPLAPAVVEQLAAAAAESDVAAGAVVISEGDPGDRFYLILDGRVDVSVDGRFVRAEGPGECFGEIALLLDVPRTATVTASTETRLLSVGREPFLLALTGHRSSRWTAKAIAAARLRSARSTDSDRE